MDLSKNTQSIAAVILGIAFVISSVVLGSGIRARSAQDGITATGSAKIRVTADSAKLTGDITRRIETANLKAGYAAAASDLAAVKKFLESQGLTEAEYNVGPLISSDVWSNGSQDSTKYDLRQSVTLDSTDIAKVKKVADAATNLIQSGVRFQTYNVEYYYSKLADQRVALLGKAIVDAKARAAEIAKSAGNSVGSLRSASSGVVQVLAPNSVSVEDYGSYDTSTIEKDIMVTVRAEFEVK